MSTEKQLIDAHIAINNHDGSRLAIKGFMMTDDLREFFVLTSPDEQGIGEAFVMAQFDEFGTFCMAELTPFLIINMAANNMSTDPHSHHYVKPPNGYHWEHWVVNNAPQHESSVCSKKQP
jgi:hypothetical protein